jgi:hypothetical protein
MPADVERIVERLKGNPHVQNPYAVAWSIHNRKQRAAAARKRHREKQQKES